MIVFSASSLYMNLTSIPSRLNAGRLTGREHRWRRAGMIAGSARGPGPKTGLQTGSNFGESLRRDCRSTTRSTPTTLASTLIQVYPSFQSSLNNQRVMPIPDNQALRKLPKDFVWGYATGERHLTK